jgi:hypothetical protein
MAEIKTGERVALSLDHRHVHLFDREGWRIGGAR